MSGMQEVERQLREDLYGGLRAREARLKERHDIHVKNKEAEEIRRLAGLKLQEREAREAACATTKVAQSSEVDTPPALKTELEELKDKASPQTSISYVQTTAQVTVEATNYRKLTAKLQFPPDYPESCVNVDVESGTLSGDLMRRLASSASKAVSSHRGRAHAGVVVDLLVKFIATNRLATAFDDLAQLRDYFATKNQFGYVPFQGNRAEDDSQQEMPRPRRGSADKAVDNPAGSSRSTVESINCTLDHVRQATGEVSATLRAGLYEMQVEATVPNNYPAEPLRVTLNKANLPHTLVRLECFKVNEMASKFAEYAAPESDISNAAVRPGAGSTISSKTEALAREGKQTVVSYNKGQHLAHAARERRDETRKRREAEAAAFIAKPSLFAIFHHLCEVTLFPLALGHCPTCKKRLLPSDPKKLCKVPAEMQALKLYCGHMYHFKCVEQFVSEPPFGKCCVICDTPIEHRLLTTDVKVLEARWAAKQAKQRELDEIVDFLS